MKVLARSAPRLRTLTTGDLAAAQALSAAVGWPHRVEDWQFLLSLGDGLVAELDDRVVGTAMAWDFGPHWGGVGMVIVAPDQQGQGIGRRLMDALLPTLAGRGIVLTATFEGQPLYRALGFMPAGTIRQHQGAPFSVGFHAPRVGERVRPAGRADLAVITALDSAATGMARGKVLAALLDVAECIVLDREGVASGFAMLRRFGRGQLIGPVIAPDAAAARLLIAHWLGQRQGEFLRIDVPSDDAMSGWLTELGLAQVDEVTRMATAPLPAPAAVRGFALVNQTLG